MKRAEWIVSGIDSPWWPPIRRHLRHTVLYNFIGMVAACGLIAALNWHSWSKRPATIVTNMGVGIAFAYVVATAVTGLVFLKEWRQREIARKVGKEGCYAFRLRLARGSQRLSDAPAIGWFDEGLFWLRSTDVGFELAPHDIATSPITERGSWDDTVLGLSSEHASIQVSILGITSLDGAIEAPVIAFEKEFRKFFSGEFVLGKEATAPPIEPPRDAGVAYAMEGSRDALTAYLASVVMFISILVPPDYVAAKTALVLLMLAVIVVAIVRHYRAVQRVRSLITVGLASD